jgi:hypothetical protein
MLAFNKWQDNLGYLRRIGKVAKAYSQQQSAQNDGVITQPLVAFRRDEVVVLDADAADAGDL